MTRARALHFAIWTLLGAVALSLLLGRSTPTGGAAPKPIAQADQPSPEEPASAAARQPIASEKAPRSWVRRIHIPFSADEVAWSPRTIAVLADNIVLSLDHAGDVLAARKADRQTSLLAAGANGDVFLGGWWLTDARDEVWIVKMAPDLRRLWSRRLLMPAEGRHSVANAMAATKDGGVVVAGSMSPEGVSDMGFVIKLRPNGQTEWSRYLDLTDDDAVNTVVETRDRGVLCAGRNRGRPWIAKLAANGSLQWQRTYPNRGEFLSGVPASDGDVLLLGEETPQPLIVKLGADGVLRWMRLVPELTGAYRIAESSPGRFAVSARESEGAVLFEIDHTPRVLWSRRVTNGAPAANVIRGIAGGGGALYYLPPLSFPGDDAKALFKLDATSGEVACGWFRGGPDLTLRELLAVPATYSIESADLPVDNLDFSIPLVSKDVASIDTSCFVEPADGEGTVAGIPPTRTSAFKRWGELERAREYEALLASKQYDKLEERVTKFRNDRSFTDPGRWEIDNFYRALTGSEQVPATEAIARSRQWAAARPESTAARIALAAALSSAASDIRGGGYAYSVSPADSKKTAALQEEALRTLKTAREAARVDAYYWRMLVSLSYHVEHVDVRFLAREAAAAGHHDPEIYLTAAIFQHPEWGGSGPRYRTFADEAARLTKPTLGEGLYAWLVYQALFRVPKEELLEDYELDWNRAKRGFADLIRLKPEWIVSYHRYAYAAEFFGDVNQARELFSRPELDWYEGADVLWRTREHYETTRTWALRPTAEFLPGPAGGVKETAPAAAAATEPVTSERRPSPPAVSGSKLKAPAPRPRPDAERLLSLDPGKWPPIVMENSLQAGAESFRQFSSFLVETPQGVVAISTAPESWQKDVPIDVIEKLGQRMGVWKMWAPGHPAGALKVGSIDSVGPTRHGPGQLGVALSLSPFKGNLPVQVLKPTPLDLRQLFQGTVYLVGCRWEGGRCRQIVVEGQIAGMGRSHRRRSWHIGLQSIHPPDAFPGGAVLDDHGFVLGVALGTTPGMSSEYAQLVEVEDVPMILNPLPN